MGGAGSKDNQKQQNVVFLGLEGGGKTNLLYSYRNYAGDEKNYDKIDPIEHPTCGFNREEVKVESGNGLQRKFNVWDLGGA